MELVTRILLAIALCAGGVAVYLIGTRLLLVALRRRVNKRITHKGLAGLIEGIPAILYFTSPDCAPCRTVQMPAINALLEQYDDQLQLIKIDATEYPEIADFWGVLSVPTTFIIDAQGQPRRVNHGIAPAAKLRQQLREIGVMPEARVILSQTANATTQPEPCEGC